MLEALFSDHIIDLAKGMNKKPRERNITLIVAAIILLISIGVVYYTNVNEQFEPSGTIKNIALIIGAISALIAFTAILSYFVQDKVTFVDEFNKLNDENQRLFEKLEEDNSVIDIIKLNLNQLNEYYQINKLQAKRSYGFSVFSITTGLLLLVSGVLYGVIWKQNVSAATIASIGGIISEFIGMSTLYLYKESSKQLEMFFKKLSRLQNVMLAIDLANNQPTDERVKQINKIINSLILSTDE